MEKEEKIRKVKIEEINLNPSTRHTALSDELIVRIKAFKDILKEAEPTPLEITIDNFRRDKEPEKEIRVWEKIAKEYQDQVFKKPNMTLQEKRQLIGKLLFIKPIEVSEKKKNNYWGPAIP